MHLIKSNLSGFANILKDHFPKYSKQNLVDLDEEWFTIETIEETIPTDKLYCISVDSEEKQFQIGELGIPTHNTDEAKALDELKGESTMIIL